MKIIPTAPTDNLYKFMAIFGLSLTVILAAVLVWFSYLSYLGSKELEATQSYYYSQDTVRQVTVRMTAITEGRLNENKLDWVPAYEKPSDEMKFLKLVYENHQKSMAESEPVMNRKSGQYFEVLEAMGIQWILPAYTVVCILLAVIGFERWYVKIQRPADKLAPFEFRIKETELKLKETELQQKEIEIQLKQAELRRVEQEESDRTRRAGSNSSDGPPPPATA